MLAAIVAFCLCGCASGDESDFCDNDAEASSVADGEVGLLVPTLKDVGLWNVDGILRNIGGKTCDVAWQGMTARFSEAKAEFYCECIAYGTESGTESRLLGEYDAVYDENNILYLGGEKFEVSRADGGGLEVRHQQVGRWLTDIEIRENHNYYIALTRLEPNGQCAYNGSKTHYAV